MEGYNGCSVPQYTAYPLKGRVCKGAPFESMLISQTFANRYRSTNACFHLTCEAGITLLVRLLIITDIWFGDFWLRGRIFVVPLFDLCNLLLGDLQ